MIELSIYRERIGRFHGGRSNLTLDCNEAIERLLRTNIAHPVPQMRGGALGNTSAVTFSPVKYLTEQLHFEVIRNPGRGLCGYRSISDALGLNVYKVMDDLAEFISNNPAFYTMFPPGDPYQPPIPHAVYVRTLRNFSQRKADAIPESYWVANLHLYCVPHIYGVGVNVFCLYATEWKWIAHNIKPGIMDAPVGNIYILHSGSNHYEWLKVSPGTVVPSNIPYCSSILNSVEVNLPSGFPLPFVRRLEQANVISSQNTETGSDSARKVLVRKAQCTEASQPSTSGAVAGNYKNKVDFWTKEKGFNKDESIADKVPDVETKTLRKPKRRKKKPLTKRKVSKATSHGKEILANVETVAHLILNETVNTRPTRTAKEKPQAILEPSSSFDSLEVLSGILGSMESNEVTLFTPSNLVSSESSCTSSSLEKRCSEDTSAWDSERRHQARTVYSRTQSQGEKSINRQSKRLKRKNEAYRSAERLSNAESKQKKRTNEKFRDSERLYIQSKRADLEFQKAEKMAMAMKRTDPVFKDAERLSDRNAKQKKRQNAEKNRNMESKCMIQSYPETRLSRNLKAVEYPKTSKAKSNSMKEKNRQRQIFRDKYRRPEFRERFLYLRKLVERRRRMDPSYKPKKTSHTRSITRRASAQTNLSRLLRDLSVVNMPCVSCKRLMFPAQRVFISDRVVSNLVDSGGYFCHTCAKQLKKGKTPSWYYKNFFDGNGIFPKKKTHVASLNWMEERLLAVSHAFLKLQMPYTKRAIPLGTNRDRGGYVLTGSVVLVPQKISSTWCQILPRCADDLSIHTIDLKTRIVLNRRLADERPYEEGTIDINKMRLAAEELRSTPVYENVTFDDEKFQQLSLFVPPCESEFTDDCNFEDIELSEDESSVNNQEGNERLAGTKYTLLVKHSEQHQHVNPYDKKPQGFGLQGCESIKLAPTEHGKPVPLTNISAFYECFPTIFMGENRLVTSESVKLDFATACKLMLMNEDTRLSKKYEALFLLYRIKQYLLLEGKIWLYMSKTKTGANLTAGLIRAGLPALQEAEAVTSFLEATRNSPQYWSRKKLEVFGFIRQLGRPNFFVTFSANECFWAPLYVLLKRTEQGDFFEQTDEKFEQLTAQAEEKIRQSVINREIRSEIRHLVQKDPITTCRYLFYRFRKMLTFLKANPTIIGRVTDYFVRVEYQQRGMPHFHCLFFTDNDPAQSADWNERPADEKESIITQFVDNVCTCHLPPEKPDGLETVRLFQFHKCYQSLCYKKNKRGPERKLICRFGFPRPPLKRTMVLSPIGDNEFSDSKKQWLNTCYDEVFLTMAKLPKDVKLCSLETTFEEFLKSLNMQENDYINCLRIPLTRERVFLKRKLCEARINNYSTYLLKAWHSNMDISYCENVYAVATYLTDYLTKSARGISSLMRQLVRELAKNPYLNALQKMNRIRDKFMGSTEIPQEEATVDLCQLSYVFTSRGTARINTHTESERVRVRKRYAEIQKLDDDSTDVFQASVVEKYVKRPKVLENICLAEYVASYHNAARKETQRSINNKELGNIDEVGDHDIIENDLDELIETTEKGIKKRRLPRVLLYRIQKESVDAEEFYRQHLLLFKHFRDEKSETDCPPFIGQNRDISARRSQFENFYTEILENRKQFHYGLSSLHDTTQNYQELINEQEAFSHNESGDRNPETGAEHIEREINNVDGPETDLANPGNPTDNDLQDEIGAMTVYKIPGLLTDSEYTELLLSLNELQRKFLFDLAHRVIDREEQVLAYLAGMAGTGKSRFIFALQQCISRFMYRGQDFIIALPVAFTGIAAVNLEGGVTIHSAFSLPLHTRPGEVLQPLNYTFSRKLADKYAHLVLLVIDEVSMVSSTILQSIDTRLRLLRGVDRAFGGISVLCVGDFNQLKPVCAPPVYQLSGDPYAMIFNNLWSGFVFFELTECMRVNREEKDFSTALNNLGKRSLDSKSLQIFNQCVINAQRTVPLECVHLFGTNEEVDLHNKQRICMAQEKSPSWESVALDKLKDKRKTAIEVDDYTKIAEKVAKMPLAKTGNLARTLILVKGLRYMVTKNISVADKLANGSVGVCFHACKNNDGTLVVYLKFANPSVGGNGYKGNKTDMCNIEVDGLEHCVIVKPSQNTFQVSSGISCTRRQVPLVPAMAITIHKSQGQTERGPLCFHPSKKMSLSSYYVALSRVTSQKNLFIDVSKTGYFCPPTVQKDEASSVIDLMAIERPYRFCLKFIEDADDGMLLRVGYHNGNSVLRYSNYINNDRSFQSCDVLCFVESRAKSRSDAPLKDFVIAAHISSSAKTLGSRIYVKHALWQDSKNKLIFEKRLPCRGKAFVEVTAVRLFWNDINIVILNIYKYNHATDNQACSVLRKSLCEGLADLSNEDAIIVVGDFNVGSGTDFSSFDDLFQEMLGVRRIIENDLVNTTKGKTSIDTVYARSKDSIHTEANVFWTPFNTQYHCPIMIKVKLTSEYSTRRQQRTLPEAGNTS